jgi:hypothetical protein
MAMELVSAQACAFECSEGSTNYHKPLKRHAFDVTFLYDRKCCQFSQEHIR